MESASGSELRKFVAPECIYGSGARLLAANYAANLGTRKALVVTDPGVEAAGWVADVLDVLSVAGVPYAVFDQVSPNPRSHEVMLGAEAYRRGGCNCIIAVGGGSPMDCAKGIGIVSADARDILEFEGVDKVRVPIPPLICIPTTGGSAADVSQFAIIGDVARGVKIAIISKAIVPDVALVDPVTLTSMPADLTAATGLDTLTHAIEAYASNAHSAITDALALDAIRLVTEFLAETMRHPLDVGSRSKISTACLQAGLAFSNAGLGLVHAMAHSLGGHLDMPHGIANALLLPFVVEFNFASADERYRSIGAALGVDLAGWGSDAARKALVGRILEIQNSVGVEGSLARVGVVAADIPGLAGKAMNDPDIATNPREPSLKDIETVYERAL